MAIYHKKSKNPITHIALSVDMETYQKIFEHKNEPKDYLDYLENSLQMEQINYLDNLKKIGQLKLSLIMLIPALVYYKLIVL
tara:strand:+ start:395 stop:640 length:246 start_codon:yes stop_codon:yes gene_type:complete